VTDRIDTYEKFFEHVVKQDYSDFLLSPDDLRKAFHCASSLFHFSDWLYAAKKQEIDAKYTFIDDKGVRRPVRTASQFANSIAEQCPEFQLIRGIAHAGKHFALKPPPPGRQNPPDMPSHAANTVNRGAFQAGVFDSGAFDVRQAYLEGTPARPISGLAKTTMEMWRQMLRSEGW
jgi:hypothetical protein